MPLKTQFQIVESPTQISEAITKFGGQPVWITHSRWPLAPETGEQMLFLGQVALNQELFPASNGAMVYLFFSEESEPLYNEAFAVVIQTSENVYTSDYEIEFVAESTGPTVYELNEEREAIYKEYGIVLESEENEASTPLEERYTMNDLDYDTGFQFARPEFAGNKIGGQPLYIEGLDTPPEYFTSDEWLLLLQLAPTQGYWDDLHPNFYPFYMELGEFGILEVFISRDYKQAICYVQQP